MRDLLVRLDTKVDNITTQLERLNQRADGHEARIATLEITSAARETLVQAHHDTIKRVVDLERWKTETVSELRGAKTVGSMVKGIAFAIVAFLTYVGYEIAVAPAEVRAPAVTVHQTR
ncbi:hypothetical protein OKW76_00500 [Sphingomonas sp. S1-29]|uniref:hypothetical protein n=1 Tax=Sphingomonas sp. S1-29 TaxID=2991074 RepID=UPI00223FABFA|nr:hypothetical protein [Sphingomonas sp. S1-29]UZK69605.1 hypothetical protein OKW76_00500 [Sphingomonas sp. S1-29]